MAVQKMNAGVTVPMTDSIRSADTARKEREQIPDMNDLFNISTALPEKHPPASASVSGAKAHGIYVQCSRFLLTACPHKQSIAFHGTSDPWADTKTIEECCRRTGIPLYETENANHSLETGDVDLGIKNIRKTMKIVRAYVLGEDPS